MRPSEVVSLLAAHGVRTTRRLGQHFLLDQKTLESVASAGGVGATDCVLEVGTGPGTLTAVLAERAARVVSVEIDSRLRPVSAEVVGSRVDRVRFLEGDVLAGEGGRLHPQVEAALAEAAREGFTIKCVSNFPYNIATPLFIRLLQRALVDRAFPLALIAGTVQLEVAERLRAQRIGKAYGAPSALVQALATVKQVRRIGRRSFFPPPRVESAVISICPLPETSRMSPADWPGFSSTVRAVFQYRRKTLRNAIRLGIGVPPETVESALRASGVAGEARIETLDVGALLSLSRALSVPRAPATDPPDV